MVNKIITISIFIVLFSSIAFSETLTSPTGGQFVFVFKTKDTLDYFIKECAGKEGRTFADDCLSCVKAIINSGTRCSVIDKTSYTLKVRVMQGPHKGTVGWVPMEMVR